MGLFDRLFGRGSSPKASADGGFYYEVRCDACGEVIRARVNPSAELSMADDGSGEYFMRKVLVGQRCFRQIELQMRFKDTAGTLASQEVSGGSFVGLA